MLSNLDKSTDFGVEFGLDTPIEVRFDTNVDCVNLIGWPVCALASDGKLEGKKKFVFLGIELG